MGADPAGKMVPRELVDIQAQEECIPKSEDHRIVQASQMTRDTYLVNSGWGYEEAAVEKLSCTSGSHPEKVTRNAQASSECKLSKEKHKCSYTTIFKLSPFTGVPHSKASPLPGLVISEYSYSKRVLKIKQMCSSFTVLYDSLPWYPEEDEICSPTDQEASAKEDAMLPGNDCLMRYRIFCRVVLEK
ncbi:hypothetical protein TURU_065550 [Turdus rufiventris]|nr:hypothetical protein TURU_065550 [Turdus rufiventris]